MKILISAFDCAPGYGSEAGIGWNWCTHLAAYNSVWVITKEANRTHIESLISPGSSANLTFIYVPTMRVSAAMRRLYGFWYLVYLDWQNRILPIAQQLDKSIDFDVVHHVSWGSLQLGSKLWRLGKPFFFGPVGGGQTAPTQFKNYFGNQWRYELLRNFVVHRLSGAAFGARRAIASSSAVFVTNSDTETLVRRLGASRALLLWDSAVPDGWLREPEEVLAADPDQPLKIIWVGTLIRRKGVGLALDVMQAIQSKANAILTIVGDGPDMPWLNAEIRRRDLVGRVKVMGRIPWSAVRRSYDEHDLMLFTSLRESLGSQLFEALSRGCAIVCLDLHGAKQLVSSRCGVRVPVTSTSETVSRLADTVASLARDRDRLSCLRTGALDVAKELTWSYKVEIACREYISATHC